VRLHERLQRWEKRIPADLVGDPIWRLPAYRIALFLGDVANEDAILLLRRRVSHHKVSQLERAVESIAANISEGYSKFSGKERARYFESALASAREAREWYRRSNAWLGENESESRRLLLTQVIRILTTAIPRERDGECEQRILRSRKNKPAKPAPQQPAHPVPSPPAPPVQAQAQATSNQ
jgi:four helix bundle protein